MATLVFGGAGYIGAHVVEALANAGETPIIVDDLSTGDESNLNGCVFHEVNLADSGNIGLIREIAIESSADAVIHLAAKKQVSESVARPDWYYQQNVGGLANVLLALEATSVQRFVFSSSAAVYGNATTSVVSESAPTLPVSPYGRTKLVCEQLLEATSLSRNFSAISLRYFNVAGAAMPSLGDRMALNLIPMVFEKLKSGAAPRIFGADYPTPDGTCVRDYIHVEDLAHAHLMALHRLRASDIRHEVYNIGTGSGTSVREIVDLIAEVSGQTFIAEILERRPGDPAQVVADAHKANVGLGWQATRNPKDIVTSAWESFEYLNSRGLLRY